MHPAVCENLRFALADVERLRRQPLAIADMLRERHNVTFTPADALQLTRATLSFSLKTIHFSPVSMDQMYACTRHTCTHVCRTLTGPNATVSRWKWSLTTRATPVRSLCTSTQPLLM